MNRRTFLSYAAATGASAFASRKRIAIIATVYRPNSHADVIAGRLIAGYEYYGKYRKPLVDVVSMYTDQVPKNDMSRGLAAQYGFRIYPTIREALTLGGKSLAVDGVVFIGEHGDYPYNSKGQHLYPRYELYKQIVDVFRESGRVAPVYCDKHFSYDWKKAKWMYDQSRELNFPLMAGSSVPLAWRRPPLELEMGTPVEHAVSLGYGEKEAYGFHALETLQCMVERRKGYETGIAAVQCLDGDAGWKWSDENAWGKQLMEQALARCDTRRPGMPEQNVKSPSVFVLEYASGLKTATYMLDGEIQSFAFAASIRGRAQPVSTLMWLQPKRYFGHFSGLVYYIEQMIITGRSRYPVERTLLTTGALAALFDSSFAKGKRIETPYLNISYKPTKESLYNRGPVPKETA